jgi:hypothetical protein
MQVVQPKLTSELNYSPPLTAFACGKGTVKVPLRGAAGRARPGKVRIKARTSDNSGRIRANAPLTLICAP